MIFTDSESPTGVAPVCEQQGKIEGPHGHDDGNDAWADDQGVYDCCPHPHIQAWGEAEARTLAAALTGMDAELCS